jgi:hypothetical protein
MALVVSDDVVVAAERMLAEAYELVLSGWCQGASAQDEEGRGIEPSSAFARRWSAPGALERIWRRADEHELMLDAYQRACLALAAAARDVPQRWNDAAGRRLDEVLDGLAAASEQLHPGVSRASARSTPPAGARYALRERSAHGDMPPLQRGGR